MAKKILIIEDEKDIRELLEHYLQREGFQTQTAGDGEAGLRKIKEGKFDLILLDLLLPRMDGLELCRLLRSQPQTAAIPLIMVTAKGEETDRVVGLEMGADDYITKPFSPRELVARVKALLRRVEKPKNQEKKFEYGGIHLDTERYEVTNQGKIQTLTAKEFKLLEFLIRNQGRVLSRDILLNEVWGYDYFGTTRTIDVHIARLRQKFPSLNKTLKAIKGLGYKLQEDEGSR
jgi:two-component system alkaline phosphatase synthesis response regulator PhoP